MFFQVAALLATPEKARLEYTTSNHVSNIRRNQNNKNQTFSLPIYYVMVRIDKNLAVPPSCAL